MRRIDGPTARDMALIERVRRGGALSAEDGRRFAWSVEDLDDAFEDEDLEEDLPAVPCDGSGCCPCGGCDGLEHVPGADTPPRSGEQHRRLTTRASGETVGPDG